MAVRGTLDAVVAVVSGQTVSLVATGGRGSDTDSGVTGGDDDTGFGALDREPIADHREPKQG